MSPYAHTILVTGLHDLAVAVSSFQPVRVLSIIQPELQPARPASLSPDQHLRVPVHDITEASTSRILADRNHVEQIIRFLEGWNPSGGALLTHCFAGVSRSTATALIAATLKTGEPGWSARRLRQVAPHAQPNPHIVALADEILGLRGALMDARAAMSEAADWPDGTVTVMRIDDYNAKEQE